MGGGQLGRMFVQAAQRMGYATVVLAPDSAGPAAAVAHQQVQGRYDDAAALAQLAAACDAVTTEFENVPAQSLAQLAQHVAVAPPAAAVQTCQDRIQEKLHFLACQVPCAPFAPIEHARDIDALDPALLPGILKTAQMGYDGKGQVRVRNAAELASAWQRLGGVRCILEKQLDLLLELSVIVARNAQGEVVHLPVQQNLHRDGILAVTEVPGPNIDDALAQEAVTAARRIAAALDYVGVLCVEFFALTDGRCVANEMAPRPHNSGHYSIEACDVSQFELQVRTLANLPLTQPVLKAPAVMLNLLGDLWFSRTGDEREPDWEALLRVPGAALHLYGKQQARPGRKMGHVTITGPTPHDAHAQALRCCAVLGIEPF
ncbi:MAG: 5-(carboxyamino)imidazole ribonucleotide synthase [Betaproteobacteria bacterium]|nr:5-(carboxyamino)imidazole ribonucleotide synthase [Betaproteobacteria bacterium]